MNDVIPFAEIRRRRKERAQVAAALAYAVDDKSAPVHPTGIDCRCDWCYEQEYGPKPSRSTVPAKVRTRYEQLMAQARGIRRVSGFEDGDEEVTALLTPAYRALLEKAKAIAPSPKMFAAHVRQAESIRPK